MDVADYYAFVIAVIDGEAVCGGDLVGEDGAHMQGVDREGWLCRRRRCHAVLDARGGKRRTREHDGYKEYKIFQSVHFYALNSYL